MTNEEREQLEKDYPQINFPRLINALTVCGVVMFITWIVA